MLATVVTSACIGISPPEVLEPATNLIQKILLFSQWPDIEASVSAAINCGKFQLGDDAKSVAIEAFRTCTMSKHTTANFSSIIAEMWNLHQTDDTGSIAGGQAVLDFVQKYQKK